MILLSGGCGGDEQQQPLTEKQEVCAAADMSDMIGDPEDFKSLFVEGAVPDDAQRMRYKGHVFAASDPAISGNTATMTVTIRKTSTFEVVGETEWTAEKVGERWVLKAAPLPDSVKAASKAK